MRVKYPDKKEFAELMDQNKGIIYKVAMLYTHNQEDPDQLLENGNPGLQSIELIAKVSKYAPSI